MSVTRRAMQVVVKSVAEARDLIRPPAPGVVVLIYHRVGGGSGLDVDLPETLFEEQMAALAASHPVISLGSALRRLAERPPPGAPSPVVVTFDDGTSDFVDRALPILVRHQIPVTLYAATEFIDRGLSFPGDCPPASWAGLADACATGLVDIGSHTHRHRLLDRLTDSAVADELDRSIDLIGEHLGRPALDFAYPKAVPGSPAADRAVRERFRSAALAGTRVNRYRATDPHQLARSPVQRSDGMHWFERKANGGMGFEDALRRLVNRRRYSAATT